MGKSRNENIKKGTGFLGSVKPSKWKQEAIYRRDNKHWLKKSQYIAIMVLKTLRERKMTQVELSTILKVTPQQVSKIVKGKENLTLETVSKLENALDIILIDTRNFNKVSNNIIIERLLEPVKISFDLKELKNFLVKDITQVLEKMLESKKIEQKNLFSNDDQLVFSKGDDESYLYTAA